MKALVYNEMLKILRNRRILVITLILLVLIPVFTYAQYRNSQEQIRQLGTSDWRTLLQQKIVDQQNRIASSRIPEEWKTWAKLNIKQQQYYLEHDINPGAPGAPTFLRKFIEQSTSLFLPLLVVVLAADIVSAEHSLGTIKLLLSRPVPRWKILLSKYMALGLGISLLMLLTALLGYVISGAVFGYRGWTMPVLTGFKVQGDQLVTQGVHLIPQWKYLLMAYGLAWFSGLMVGTLSFMVSVLVKSTAASIGIMLAAVISGSLLTQMAPTWTALKYFAFTHLSLTDYLAGNPILIEGMSLPFSLTVLSVWAILALTVAFITFMRRDVLA
ncbi:ABC transporter permease [Thermoactinomyces mirandus]|uniref:ABC transporter permease n=1 Tax=Thermoactinomyces mirandus TaxID=2756294 RepID=A0A7W1XPV3_9BACL|nr:ABC transporter permease [Thermoactinomyces mirandus]MBA4600820.1 ABC transporter permease [Thermoactinomyces mirandus]